VSANQDVENSSHVSRRDMLRLSALAAGAVPAVPSLLATTATPARAAEAAGLLTTSQQQKVVNAASAAHLAP
jgi:hypothetical protein